MLFCSSAVKNWEQLKMVSKWKNPKYFILKIKRFQDCKNLTKIMFSFKWVLFWRRLAMSQLLYIYKHVDKYNLT